MAQKDHPDEGPTLELPSLFRRKKKTPQVETDESPAVDTDLAEPVAATQTEVLDEPVQEPVEEPSDLVAEPVEPDVVEPELVEPEPAPVIEEPPVELAPESVELEPEPTEVAPLEEQPVAAAPLDTPVVDDEPVEVTSVEAEPFEDEAPPEPVAVPREPKPPMRDRIEAGLPDLAAGTASIVVGAVVGLLGCVATFLSLKGCELATGTDSCGGPGLLVLIVILVGMILVGAMLLRLFRVAEPGNLSFLGVAITAVVILVLLIKYLFSAWMFAVVPVLSALSFALARWVTTRWTDDGDDLKDDYSHDVR
jgi:hypothetical protein